MLEPILTSILVVAVLIRSIRLVAWVQQKEYRLDRILLFLHTKEGLQELVRFFPSFSEVITSRFKRPQKTVRALGTIAALLGSAGALTVLFTTFLNIHMSLVLVLILLPLLAAGVGIVPSLLRELYTDFLLRRVAQMIGSVHPFIVGITGSFGKTSTKLLLAEVLSQHDAVFYTPASFNTPLSVARTVLQHYASQTLVILEYAAYRTGEIARLAKYLPPHLVVLTGVTEQHLGLFGSVAAICTAKAELLSQLPAQSVVILANKSAAQILEASRRTDLRVQKAADSSVSGSLTTEGYLQIQHKNQKWQTQLVGMHSLELVQTVCLAAESCGLPTAECCARIALFTPPREFMRIRTTQGGALCIDDSRTSNNQGFEAAIALLNHLSAQKKIVLTSGIVDAGSHAREIHLDLAKKIKNSDAECWHVGKTGRAEFVEIFGKRCSTDEKMLRRRMSELNNTTALLIEGRMPSWVTL